MGFRRKIVAGNWKMNNTLSESLQLVDGILAQLDQSTITEVIICPPAAFISPIHTHLKDLHKLKLGAQNCSEHISGAYTGEISAAMLKSANCEYVIIGHSERRTYFKETKEQLIEKTKRVLENHMAPIVCIGEHLEDRKQENHFEVVKQQLNEVLGAFSKNELTHLVIAYEPVWAIGTGLTATATQAQEMHAFIRKSLSELFDSDFAAITPILYGGSCNAQNAADLFSCADVDGGLIGGASLKASDFCKIVASA
jgi:triosephosphate isomerase (TIM)